MDLEPVVKPHDVDLLQALVENHRRLTGSAPAQYVLENWDNLLPKFVKVMPIDYRRVLGADGAGAGTGSPGPAGDGRSPTVVLRRDSERNAED